MELADGTSSRVTAFNDVAENILGMSTQELVKLKENDKDDYWQKFSEANFKTFMFNLRAKSDIFQVIDTMCILLFNYISHFKVILFYQYYYTLFLDTIFSANFYVFQDEMRINYICTSVRYINYKTYLSHLIDNVFKLINIEKLDFN